MEIKVRAWICPNLALGGDYRWDSQISQIDGRFGRFLARRLLFLFRFDLEDGLTSRSSFLPKIVFVCSIPDLVTIFVLDCDFEIGLKFIESFRKFSSFYLLILELIST